MFDNGKAKTGAAQLATAGAIGAIKPLENSRQIFGRNANTLVRNRQHKLAIARDDADHDSAAFVGILDGVIEQIVDDFFQPRSWRVAGGWHRSFLKDGSEPLVASLDGGAGAAWSSRGHALFYTLGEAAMRAHHNLEHGYDIGAGGRVGALVDPAPRWRLHAYASGINYCLGQSEQPRALGLQQRFAIGRDSALRLDVERRREGGRHFDSASLSLQLYF